MKESAGYQIINTARCWSGPNHKEEMCQNRHFSRTSCKIVPGLEPHTSFTCSTMLQKKIAKQLGCPVICFEKQRLISLFELLI